MFLKKSIGMKGEPQLKNEQDIIDAIQADEWMMRILRSARKLNLADWWICAGFVRTKIWDIQHGFEKRTELPDIDVIYFDPKLTGNHINVDLEERLKEIQAGIPWSVKNQASMHLRNEVAPYESSTDAMGKFPEIATAIGVTLTDCGQVKLAAPHGVADVLQCMVRPTPFFKMSAERLQVYQARMEKKKWQNIWPQVSIYFE